LVENRIYVLEQELMSLQLSESYLCNRFMLMLGTNVPETCT